MLPLRDDIPSRRFPVVTVLLIFLNLVVFLFELALGDRLSDFILNFGIIPVLYTHPEWVDYSVGGLVIPFFSSMFLHGGWLHLIGNMWTLWIFGDNVEDRLGSFCFLGFYLFCGCIAGLVHILTNPSSTLPTIGASGAVAGIMGSYFRFYPHARVEAVIPPFILGPIFELPAVIFLGWWILLQFMNGAMTLLASGSQFGGVAWWAHVGGFFFGMAVCFPAPRRRPQRQVELPTYDVEP